MEKPGIPFHERNPKLSTDYLILLSGLIWTGVGVKLLSLAFEWFHTVEIPKYYYLLSGGFLLSLIFYKFQFRIFANRNIVRLENLPDKINIFAFQRLSGYLIVIVMISLGIFLRTSGILPLWLLAFSYEGVGLGIGLGSLEYYYFLYSKKNKL